MYAEDEDDWDVDVKTFTLVDPKPEHFTVDSNDGKIRINEKTPSGNYSFKVSISDCEGYHNQDEQIILSVANFMGIITVTRICAHILFSSLYVICYACHTLV